MYQIKRIEMMSAGKLGSIILGIIFFVWGLLGAATIISVDAFIFDLEKYKIPVKSISLAWLLINCAIGIIGGFLLGAAISGVYNVFTRLLGGLGLDIVQIGKKTDEKKATACKN